MTLLRKDKTRELLRKNEAQITGNAYQQLLRTTQQYLNELIVFSKIAAKQDGRTRLFPEDIKAAAKMYVEAKNILFLDQLELSVKRNLEEYFENKRTEVEQWQKN